MTDRALYAPCPSCGQDVPDTSTSCPHCGTRWTDTAGANDTVSDGAKDHGDLIAQLETPDEGRFTTIDELGRGGMGTVFLARDSLLRRNVAYKVLHRHLFRTESGEVKLDQLARFVSECQAAAQLQHPSIVPIYDIGIRKSDGCVFFTMKAVMGKTLKQHLVELRDSVAEPGMTRFRALQILHQVCQAIAYMHSQRVLHRDLKPQNVMVGEFGEVYVVDFGLAKVRGSAVSTLRSEAGQQTNEMVIEGTPAYMAPEQVADSANVDEATDQWALGAILYEILTYRPPYVGTEGEMFRKALACKFSKPTDVDPDIPRPLEEICLKAMAQHRYDRFPSVKRMADRLQEFLDGEKEMERRNAAAAVALGEAQEELRRHEEFEREAANVHKEFTASRAALPALPTSDEQLRVNRIQERAQRMAEERDRAFTDAIRKFVRAIDVAPDNRIAREMLADLAFDKMIALERSGKKGEVAYLRALVESYHQGKYAVQLQGDGTVSIVSTPARAHAYLATYVPHGTRLAPENERYLGTTPIAKFPLPMGSYLLTLRLDGCPDTIHPFVVGRNEQLALSVRILRSDEIPARMVYIPAGRFFTGGDPSSEDPSLIEKDLPGFCIGRHPVTMDEYLAFINSIAASEGAEAALQRVPRVQPSSGHYFLRQGDAFALPEHDGTDPWDPRLPAVCITALDAEAYCAWLSGRDGRPYRLPSSDEWDKAARGADGRLYPWGNGWERGLSHSSVAGAKTAPEPVDGRPADVSPYGVAGIAGNVSDWTSTTKDDDPELRCLRGSTYFQADISARVPMIRWNRAASCVTPDLGFRIAMTVESG